jgi:YbgC/YbaW family acyl-CoA thioester hydrolase
MHEFTTTRRVEFADTDMGGIVHFARYFVFMETAEHQFLAAAGTSVSLVHDGLPLGWPRVAATCEYRSPARFGDELSIRVRVGRRGRSSMTYEFSFERDEEVIAEGRMTSVCCVLEPGRPVRSIPIPEPIARLLGEPARDLEDPLP